MIALAGQMAGVPSGPLQPSTTLPLRYQVGRASEPTLCPEPPSGSPPLLVSSGGCRNHRSARDYLVNHRRCRSVLIVVRCDWVGHSQGAPVAPPAAADWTGALPHLEGNDHHHCLHLRHHWPHFIERGGLQLEVSPTHPHEEGHRAFIDAYPVIYLINYKRNFHHALNFGCFKFVV